MPFDDDLLARAAALVERCTERQITLASAESCTGGLLGALLTETAGSSAVFGYGFITYANVAKRDLLGVPAETLDRYGAVSPETAAAMASGALKRANAHFAVAVTGVAGPGGGSAAKPVGLVHFGLASRQVPAAVVERRFGDIGRGAIRMAAVRQALSMLEAAAFQDVSPP